MGNLKEGIDQTYGGCKRTPNLLCFVLHWYICTA